MNRLEINRAVACMSPNPTISELLETNSLSAPYGLKLSPLDALEIVEKRNLALSGYGMVELSTDPVIKIINEFCSSPYINPGDFLMIINELIDIYYYIKNELEDLIGDNELILTMKYFFNHSCQGSTELLKNREMALLVRIIKKSAEYSRGNK